MDSISDSVSGVLGTLVYGLGITGAGLLAAAGSTDAALSARDAMLAQFQEGSLTVPLFEV